MHNKDTYVGAGPQDVCIPFFEMKKSLKVGEMLRGPLSLPKFIMYMDNICNNDNT